jgi:adenylate kinase family enzyme
MKKVAIIGCGGSGKSHVARTLGNLLDAPVTHLDAV